LENEDQVNAVNASKNDCRMEVRLDRVRIFNTALRKHCEYHNNNNPNGNDNDKDNDNGVLKYYDVVDEVLTTTTETVVSSGEEKSNNYNDDDDNGDEQHQQQQQQKQEQERVVIIVKDAYTDVSDLNIHLFHETTLQLWYCTKMAMVQGAHHNNEDNNNQWGSK